MNNHMNIFQKKEHTFFNTITGLLILLFPALLVLIPNGGGGILLLLVIISTIGLILNKEKTTLHPSERHYMYAVGMFLLVYILNIWFIGSNISSFDNPSRFLILLPAFFFLRKVKLNLNYIVLSLFLGTFSCMTFAFYQTYILQFPRALGITSVVPFGGISITLGLMSFAIGLLSSTRWLKYLMITSFFFGLNASLLSGSRGAWLALPICLLIVLLINPVQWNKRLRMFLGIMSLVIISASYFLPTVQSRADLAINELNDYFNKDMVNTSLGLRLETWRAAAITIYENPVFGVGEGKFHHTIQQLADQGRVSPVITTNIAHIHNEFIAATFHRGIIGLITLLLIFFLPLTSFITSIKEASGDKKILLLTGIMLITSSLTLSLSDIYFYRHNTTILYAIYIYFIYAQVYTNKKERAPLNT